MSQPKTTLGARDVLFLAQGIQKAREVILPMLYGTQNEARRIATLDADGVVTPDVDLAALNAAEALATQYETIQSSLQGCIIRIMAGREDNLEDLFARLRRDAREECPLLTDLPVYRIHTQGSMSKHLVATEEEALDAFARDAGYRDYAELADSLGKTIDEARADLVIERRESIEEIAERARKAPSLLRLWDAVEGYVEACREQHIDYWQAGLDLTDLPIFGGEAPATLITSSGLAALSWDETHVLIQTRSQKKPYVVVRRSDYA